MFILGTSTVLTFLGGQPINVIGPIPQTFRVAFGSVGAAGFAAQFGIFLLMARAVASASLIFTGLTRLPLATAWDNLVPRWFTRLDQRRQTPVNSIYFVAVLVMGLILLSLLGVQEQEASQLLSLASIVHYAIAYVALFALPLFGNSALRRQLPRLVESRRGRRNRLQPGRSPDLRVPRGRRGQPRRIRRENLRRRSHQ